MRSLLFTFILFTLACGTQKSASAQANDKVVEIANKKPVSETPQEIVNAPDEIEPVAGDKTNKSEETKTADAHKTSKTVEENDSEKTINNTVATPEEMAENDAAERMGQKIQYPDHSVWTELLQLHVTDQGKVNYKGFIKDRKRLLKYTRLLSENRAENSWSKEQKLAYWINVYNAFTVKLIIDNYPVQSIKDLDNPWKKRFFKLGAKWYNLEEVEHQILRKMNEPRIHFAINCASVSCPKLVNEAFIPSNIEKQLSQATKEFLTDQSKNMITANNLRLSKIFRWFGKDFKVNGGLVAFLNKYSALNISQNARISYQEYDWNLNE